MEEDPILETQDTGLGVSRLLRKYSPTPFLIYRQRQLPNLQKQNPQAKVADLVKILQVQWKEEDASSAERIQCTTISDLIRGQLRECLHHAADVSSWLSTRHDMKQAMASVGVRPPKFLRHLGPFGSNESEQKRNFLDAWRAFSPDNLHVQMPSFARQKIGDAFLVFTSSDLFNLYRSVVSLGGFEHVSERQLWDTVVNRQGLDSVCTPTDKAAVMILRIGYFTLLLEFELQYQFGQAEEKSNIPNVPVHPMLTLPISPFTPSNFSSNHYRQPGMAAILFSLRSRLCSCVCWALNHLLLISYNQNRPILLADYPALLEILVALLERQLLVIDLSVLGSRSSLPNVAHYTTNHQTISHNVLFPDITGVLLVIIKNLSYVAANQPRIAQHHSCAGDLLDNVFQHDIAGDVLLLIAQYLDVSKLNFTNLSRWLHKSLQSVQEPRIVIRALEMVGTLCLNTVNHGPLTTQMHIEVFHLVVSLLCYPDCDDVLIAALETLAKLTAVGGVTFAIRIVAHTSIIDRLVEVLLRPARDGDVNDVVIRRTASQILADLYAPEDNRPRFRPFLSSMFRAVNKNFEVGALLAPVLRVSAQVGR